MTTHVYGIGGGRTFTRIDVWTHYFSYLETLDEVLTDAHLRNDEQVVSCTMRAERGGVWTASLRIKNPGLTLFAPGRQIYCAIIESPDGTIANSRILGKGRITPAVNDMTGMTIDIEVVFAPANLRDLIWQFLLSSNLTTLPWFNPAYDDISFDKPEDVLKASGLLLHVDPVTHVISTTDSLIGDETNLDNKYDWKSLKIETSGVPPVHRVKLRLAVEWTQHAQGAINIAQALTDPTTGCMVTTLSGAVSDFMPNSMPGQYVTFANGTGWTPDYSQISVDYTKFGPFYTGRTRLVQQTHFYWASDASHQVVGGVDMPVPGYKSELVEQEIDECCSLWGYSYKCTFAWFRYEYTQQRREFVTILYEYPLQPVIGTLTELDLGTVSVTDLLTNYQPNPAPPPASDAFGNYVAPWDPFIAVQPFDPSAIYMTGNLVTFGDNLYRCTADNVQGNFYQPIGEGLAAYTGHPNWILVDRISALSSPIAPAFVGSSAGGMCIEHGILRCRNAARARSEYFTVAFETDWDHGVPITLLNSVRITALIRTTGVVQPLLGKVRKIERVIDPIKGKRVKIEIGVCVGTGFMGYPTPALMGDASPDFAAWFNGQTTELYGTFNYFNGGWQGLFPGLAGFTGYYPDSSILGSFANNDYLWTAASDPVIIPVDASQLSNPGYAVWKVDRYGTAAEQCAAATSYAMSGIDPRDAIRDNPTHLEVYMRPLVSEGVIQRNVDVAAAATASVRGIDLSTPGGEP